MIDGIANARLARTSRVQPRVSRNEVEASDADEIERLGDEIATLSAHIHAATHRLLVLIGEFDRLHGWELGGYSNCARWLAARTGIDLGAAREKVRAARALETLPLTGAAMARGELSFSQVRALSRVARTENEAELLELARGTTTAQLERMVRAWKKGNRTDEAEWERERHLSRAFSVFPDDDGMYVVRGRLTPEVGALLMRAIDAAGDALFRAPGRTVYGEGEASQRRADAVGLVAERALAARFDERDRPSAIVPISGTRAQRYQVVLHVEAATLSAETEAGRSELDDGTRVSAETSRRLSCDASKVEVTHATDGSILNVGRKTRTISPGLRRALEVRDRGCRFPRCQLRFTDAHHLKHWADGGETGLANCILLCSYHHRLVHEGGWRVEWWGKARPVFLDPRGGTHFDGSWEPPELPEQPVAALIQANERLRVEPGEWTSSGRWEREADIPDAVYFRALEALQ
ncbi:MAG: DUF222 domain-containing protein [Longimicrobiales bacterium]